MNEGVEIASEVAHGPASLIEQQVTNGIAMRMAILDVLLRARAEIGAHADA
jgi:aspartate carbamoyltransferase catalytic subunit